MSRYKVEGSWHDRDYQPYEGFIIQHADARDTKIGTLYWSGAYRVLDAETRKPAKRGKGGTVPFYGETAWNDAERLASDLYFDRRFAR